MVFYDTYKLIMLLLLERNVRRGNAQFQVILSAILLLQVPNVETQASPITACDSDGVLYSSHDAVSGHTLPHYVHKKTSHVEEFRYFHFTVKEGEGLSLTRDVVLRAITIVDALRAR